MQYSTMQYAMIHAIPRIHCIPDKVNELPKRNTLNHLGGQIQLQLPQIEHHQGQKNVNSFLPINEIN